MKKKSRKKKMNIKKEKTKKKITNMKKMMKEDDEYGVFNKRNAEDKKIFSHPEKAVMKF